MCNSLSVRRTFKEAETDARLLFDRRGHQTDVTGVVNKDTIPSYVHLSNQYFEFNEERSNELASVRASQWRNMRVNRSVIGQQFALSDFNYPTLITTVATLGRDRGSGEVAGEIVIIKISQTSSESNNEISEDSRERRSQQTFIGMSTTNRLTAPNDGRSNRATRRRRYNVSSYPTLPPSTGGHRSVNIDRMEMGYNSIVDSINNLAYQQHIRTRIDINLDIQVHADKKTNLMADRAHESVITT